MNSPVRNPLARTCVAALVSLMVGLTAFDSLAAGPEPKRVFVLNSFNRGYTWTDNMLRGVDDAFAASGIMVETYVTFMDMKRIPPTLPYFSKLKDLIQDGYRGVRFDAVLACDNDALNFMRQYRDELFPGVPVVFCSINDFDERMLDGRKDITGTSENTDYAGTIRAALTLRPATNNIVVVTDATTTGQAHRSAVDKLRASFPQRIGFTHISLADMTLDELAKRLSQLNKDSIVLLLQHFVDINGTTYTVKQSTPLLTKISSVPVFVTTDIRMGLGALGGHVVSGYHHGTIAAQMVTQILRGTDVRTIPVLLDSPNTYMFDYSVMRRFGISASDLPPGSLLINRSVSVLDEYKPYLLATLAVVIALSGILVYLLLETRRRRTIEEALRETGLQYRTLFESIADTVFVIDQGTGRLLDVNPAATLMYGFSREDFLRMTLADVSAESDALSRLTSAPDPFVPLRYHRHKEAGVFPVELTAGSFALHGKMTIIATTRDITERKRAEDALARLNAQLRAKNKELERIVYVASHDLRGPLVNMAGYGREVEYAVEELSTAFETDHASIEALKVATRAPVQEMSAALRYIRSSTSQMDALLTGLLHLARSGRASLTITPLDMNELICGVVAAIDFQVKSAGAALYVAELPPCRGDAVQVTQVFTNLLSNALRYLHPDRPGVIRISGIIEGEHSVYSVEDNGIGIAPAHQEDIFEVFHRLEPSKSDGEGLGLTIVRQILGRLAGEVGVESTPGEGSRFFVALPVADRVEK